ncbi:M61 family metallopeptidase [Lysobacter tyrosinilyticus]
MPLPWPTSFARLLLAPALAAAGAAHGADALRTHARENDELLHTGNHSLHVEFVGVEDDQRRAELRRWLAETAEATLTAYGRLPLREATVRVEEVRSRSRSPVPWGQTERSGRVAVLLYVRQGATMEELRADWTAVHELSHLFHPYLGDDGRWLAEGLASYYQNVLRARSGLLDEAEAWRRLDGGFGRGRAEGSGLRLDELSRSHRGTMRVYWAGAAYWLEMDLALRRAGSSLDNVLARYSDCCLQGGGEVAPEDFVARLDRIAGGERFAALYRSYVAARSFPSLDSTYAALGLSEADTGELRLSDDVAAVRLRRAVMGRR